MVVSTRWFVVRTALLAWLALALCCGRLAITQEPLASWNDTAPRQAIIEFVERVTTEGSADYVPPAQRIAVFDQDGTLWCEQPMYAQLAFALDRVKVLAPDHPEWANQQPYSAILSGDSQALAGLSHQDIAAIISATHAGMTTDEFADTVGQWLATARHPRFQRPYTELVYQPMLELLDYLRDNGFKTCIVSGGGVDFMRVYTQEVYGIPPEQIIGSSGKTKFETQDGVPVLLKLPEIQSVDDGPGKPENIHLHIGQRPLMAFGNSDGDQQMLEWTTGSSGPRFGLLVHHTDAQREYAYDRDSHVGKLDKALDAAPQEGWTVVDMQEDWGVIFPPPSD